VGPEIEILQTDPSEQDEIGVKGQSKMDLEAESNIGTFIKNNMGYFIEKAMVEENRQPEDSTFLECDYEVDKLYR